MLLDRFFPKCGQLQRNIREQKNLRISFTLVKVGVPGDMQSFAVLHTLILFGAEWLMLMLTVKQTTVMESIMSDDDVACTCWSQVRPREAYLTLPAAS